MYLHFNCRDDLEKEEKEKAKRAMNKKRNLTADLYVIYFIFRVYSCHNSCHYSCHAFFQ